MNAVETIQTTEVEVEPALRATTPTRHERESETMASAVLAGARVDPAAARVSDLHAEYGDAVYRYCRRHLRSREDAEDATQVVFMNAYRSLAKGAEPINDSAWLFKIAENAVLYRRRRIVARERVEIPVPDTIIDLNPALTAEAYGAGRQIVDALGRMPLEQQRAIVLREWQGLAYREVAETLGVSETTAAMLVIRARAVLARELERPSVFRRLGFGWLGWLLAPLDRIAVGSVATKAAAGLAGAAAVAVPVGTVVVSMPPRHSAETPRQVAVHHGRSHHHRASVRPSANAASYAASSGTSTPRGSHSRPLPNSVTEVPPAASGAPPPNAVGPQGAAPAADPIAADPVAPTADAPANPPPSSDPPAPAAADPAAGPPPDEATNVDQPTPHDPAADEHPPPVHTNSGTPGKSHPAQPPQARNDDSPSANAPGQTGIHLFGANAP